MRAEKTSPRSGTRISGSWYYFDENGYITTGWRQISGKWYYLESDGKMATGWKQLGGKWYYLDADGSMATGWRPDESGPVVLSESGRINGVVDSDQW